MYFITLLAGVLGAMIGAIISRRLVIKKESIVRTISVFNQWHSDSMFESRRGAWEYLTQAYPKDPVPYYMLFEDEERFKEKKSQT